MNHDPMHDGTITGADPDLTDGAARTNVSPHAVQDWQPRNRDHVDDPRWCGRHVTWLLMGAVLIVLALVAITFRGGPSTHDTAPGTATNMSAMPGMAGTQMSTDGAVALTRTQIEQFGVTFGMTERRPLTNTVRTAGVVVADETRLTSITPRFGGYIERLYVNSMGEPVRKGQPLASVYSPDVLGAEQELLLARGIDNTVSSSSVPGVADSSTDLLGAARRRLQLWGVTNAQIDQVLRTGRPAATVTLYSPASGVVTDKKVIQGQAIQPGMDLYTITDLSEVWVDAEIREADAGLARVGASATLEFAGYPGKQYVGQVSYIYPTVGVQSRTLKARIVVSNSNGLLKPGMYATVNLVAPARTALTVPSSAVVQTGERTLVFVDQGNGKLVPHDVEVGRTGGDYTEVLSGVQRGQRVVTSAQFLIDSESNLGEVMKSMIGSGGSSGER